MSTETVNEVEFRELDLVLIQYNHQRLPFISEYCQYIQ